MRNPMGKYSGEHRNIEGVGVGYFDATEEFVSAVEDNPVLEGWGNKIVVIGDGR
ncbi:MAG: hypothetical protein HFG71_08225 [Hungatella sp.]|nr:hypothetical protein [Hungatella sp.]